MSDIIKLNINNHNYDIPRQKLTSNSQYFNTMLTNFAEKDKNVIAIKVDEYYDENILDNFIKFIDTESLNLIYAYPIYLLLKYFEYNDTILEKFKQLVVDYEKDIDINIILSLVYLSREVEYIDLYKYLRSCVVDDNYLNFLKNLYPVGLNLNDFLNVYQIWKANLSLDNDKHQEYLLIDIFQLDRIRYKALSNDSLGFVNPLNKCVDGKKIAVKNLHVFKKNLLNLSLNLIDRKFIKKLDWTDICISGGAVLASLLRKPLDIDNSDIDFWIYGNNYQERYRYLVEYFEKKFPNISIYYSVISGVTTLLIPEYGRNIQIILTEYKTPYDIISNFDMSYTRCVYDGKQVLGTLEFVQSLETQTIDNDNTVKYSVGRIAKAYRKGYSFKNLMTIEGSDDNPSKEKLSQYIVGLLNDKRVIKNMNKYYYPSIKETNDPDRLKFVIKQIFNSDDVYVGSKELFKNFRYEACDFNTVPYTQKDMDLTDNLDLVKIGKHDYFRFHGMDMYILYLEEPIIIKTPYLLAPNGITNGPDGPDGDIQIMLNCGDNREFIDQMCQLADKLNHLANLYSYHLGIHSSKQRDAYFGDMFNRVHIISGGNLWCKYKSIQAHENLQYVRKNVLCSVELVIYGIGRIRNTLFIKREFKNISVKTNIKRYLKMNFE